MSIHCKCAVNKCTFSESFEPFADLIVKQIGEGGRMSNSLIFKLGVVVLLGALGYLYYALVGCQSGTCPISSNPYISTGYGAVIGALIGFGILPGKKRNQSNKE